MRWPRRLRRAAPTVDRAVYTHDYVGPQTKWGLTPGTPVRILGKGGGGDGRRVITPAGRRWTLSKAQLKRAE